jgi:hypothetical protein
MQLTDPEFIEARKRALENNPRSYEPWYETIMYGREVERLVQQKYWRDYSKEKPHEEGWYVVVYSVVEGVATFVDTFHWSNTHNQFITAPGTAPVDLRIKPIAFKSMNEIVESVSIMSNPT